MDIGNTDTLLDEISDESDVINSGDKEYIFAPGEGQRPLSLYRDDDAEYLSFPTIFCGQKRPDNKERSVPVHYTDIVKWELRSVDRRVAQSVPNIFFKLKKIQLKNIADKVNLALRRCKSEGKKWRAKDILDPSTVNDLVRLDEGYFIFRTLRNSPVYLEKRKKDVFAMIRQLGLPTWFGSFSSADTKWLDLLKVLGNLNDGKNYSEEELEHMSWHEKTRLVQRDPVTCSRFFDYRVQQFIRIVLKSNFHPIGKISYYFYRVEFQQRGSPHIHILIWIENALIYKKDSEEKIVEYIDKHVSCSKTIEFEDLVKLQVHKHSKTCRKKGHPVCRFGFPLPPMQNTVILEPLESEVDKYKNLYNEMQKKINTLHDYDGVEDMSFDDFIHNFLETNLEEYIKIIRSNLNGPKVFLARKPSEVRVNAYMKIVLSAWKANHDLQFVLDPYACAMYIVSYISKSQKGMSALLDQAAKEARQGNLDLKRQVRHIGNYFTNSVETCAQEAIYLTLQLPLTKATRKVVFINTSSSNKRTFLLKQTSALEKLAPDSTDIEAGNDIKRYSMRPKVLENWCLADYISQLDIKFPKQANNEIENDYEENCTEDEESEMEDESEIGKKICIKLKNGVTIKQRQTKSFKVIRYVRFNKKTDSENFYRERLMLFYPWRNETTDLKNQYETYEEMYMTVRRIIENKAKQYEHNAEELDKAMEQAEEDCAQYDAIAPGTQQRELDDLEESVEEAEQYIHFNPDRAAEHKCYDIGQDIGICQKTLGPTSIAVRMNDADYHQLIRSLNIKQREFYHHVVTWIKTKDEPLYAFLTGGAGVGKSVVVRALYQGLHRYLCSKEGEDPDDVRILLCAPTGKSAYNINGLTLHNAFHVQGNKCKGAKLANQRISFDVLNTLRMKYRNLTVIMIDEISMVGNEMFSIIESRAKKIKENKKTFGGISVIVIGDLLQLQPVGEGWVFSDLNKGISSLAPNLWKELFYMHELTDIMRQKDDMDFARLLNRLRENKITENDLSILESRIIKENDHLYPSGATHLFISNKLVDDHNKEIIRNLQTQKVTIKAFDVVQANVSPEVKKILISNLPQNAADTANLSKEVEIAVDMKYDFTVNVDIADGLTNGASCEVKMIENKQKDRTSRPSIVWVKFDEDNIGARARKRYSSLYGPNIDKSWTPIFDIKRSFIYKWKTYERIQFPLRAAAAKTIHKSQGCTLDEVVVKLTSKNPNKHIHYVALSRVTSLNGLHILDLNSSKIGVSNVVMEENKRLRTEAVLELCYKPLYTIGNSFLKFVFNNCRSLHAHFKDVKHEPNIINADVIGLAESRLVSLDLDEDYSLPGFAAPIRMDQITANSTTRPYHGLLLYVKNDFFIENVVKFSSTLVEFIMADIICGRGHMQAVVLYKSPECGIEQLKDILISELLPTLDIDCNILIMGDFNLDIRSGNQNFLKFMEKKFICKQEISKVTTNYGSILDLFFVKVNQDVDIESDVVEAYWSDHKIVYTAVDL